MYAKIFEQIFDSSIAKSAPTRRMFQDLLILADSDGIIDMTHFAIAQRLVVPESEVRQEIDNLCAPDPESRTPDMDGRRLIPIDPKRGWGWQIVNIKKYREMRDEDDRKRQNREYSRRYRERTTVRSRQIPSDAVSTRQPRSAHTEGDTDTEGCSFKKRTKRAVSKSFTENTVVPLELPSPLNFPDVREMIERFIRYRAEANFHGKKKPMHKSQIQTLIETLAEYGRTDAKESLRQSMMNNWPNVYPPKNSVNSFDALDKRLNEEIDRSK